MKSKEGCKRGSASFLFLADGQVIPLFRVLYGIKNKRFIENSHTCIIELVCYSLLFELTSTISGSMT